MDHFDEFEGDRKAGASTAFCFRIDDPPSPGNHIKRLFSFMT